MDYHAGDTVVHWMHGLGKVLRREKRDVLGQQALYYAIQVGNMVIWVPVDAKVRQRLRPPAGKIRFKRMLSVLSSRGKTLPIDRHERKLLLAESLQDGRLESVVTVIRDLLAFQRVRPLNDSDQALMRRAQSALAAEWAYVLQIAPAEAEFQLSRLLKDASPGGRSV
jgi:RNA polymerase-interacting CarD/CdnL/TRCF family regulator